MAIYKERNFAERRQTANDAKKALLEKFKARPAADDPAVLALVASTLRGGAAARLPVSLCGDAGSDLAVLPKLLACGLRRVSVAPAALARVKAAIAGMRLGDDG